MEAKNLRIGNLIDIMNRSNEFHYPYNFPRKVFKISLFEIEAYLPHENPANLAVVPTFNSNDICGLKFTEKWIEKFGRENIAILHGLELHGNDSRGYGYSDEYGRFIEIEYVHELQNIFFALTGNELELET